MLNIRQRILTGIGTILVLWLGITGAVFLLQERQVRLLEEYARASEVAAAAGQVQLAVAGLLSPVAGHIQSPDKEHLKDFEEEMAEYRAAMAQISESPDLSGEARATLMELKDLVENIRSTGSRVLKAKEITSTEESMVTITESLVNLAKEKGGDLRRYLRQRARSQAREVQQQSRFTSLASLGVTGVGVLIALPLTFLMVGRIRRTATDIRSRIQEESSSILASVEGQLQFTTEQNRVMDSIAQSMEQMGAASRDIASSAASVDDLARRTRDSARSGSEDTKRLARSIQEIRRTGGDGSGQDPPAGVGARRIAEAVSSISEVAEEVHTLALNAAIESVAAGEGDRRSGGPGVEVRRLAERTRDLTDEANSLMREVWTVTDTSMMATGDGVGTAENGMEITRHTGKALSGILEMTDRTVQAAREITFAVERQDASTAAVRQQVEDISARLGESAQSLQYSKEIANRLRRVSDRMSREL